VEISVSVNPCLQQVWRSPIGMQTEARRVAFLAPGQKSPTVKSSSACACPQTAQGAFISPCRTRCCTARLCGPLAGNPRWRARDRARWIAQLGSAVGTVDVVYPNRALALRTTRA